MPAHLGMPPSAAFWLDELQLADFEDALALAEDTAALRDAVNSEFSGPAPRRALEALSGFHPGDEVQAHALLVAWFLRQKKSAAVVDVAEAVLPAEELAGWQTASGRLHRLPTALELYRQDPLHLLDVEVCHRWHSRRRCALELEGPKRTLPAPGDTLDWRALAAEAQAHLEADVPKLRGRLRFRRVTFRREGKEVLLAWRAPAERDTVRHAAGHVVAGHHDDWIILRVYRDGNRVDVTSGSLSNGRMLADGLARAVWGKGHYRVARHALTGDALNELLRRMRSPEDDVFRLLEIAGEVHGLPNRPIVTITNAGQARVETAVEELRRHMTFAERWQTVHRVKLAFGRAWRIEVHFPPPDGELVLSYSDTDRDKEVAAAFEALVLDELGVEIHPKAGRARRRERGALPEPTRPGRPTWLRLLGPVLDEPATWEGGLVRDLAERGVVALTEHSFFRCGDGPVLPGRRDTLDCPGEIEMPYGELDPNDPYRQEDDAECVCGTCGTTWYPGRYRLPVTRRLRVRPDVDGAWRYVRRLLSELGVFYDEGAGLAGGVVRGQRAQVFFCRWWTTRPCSCPTWRRCSRRAGCPCPVTHGSPRSVRGGSTWPTCSPRGASRFSGCSSSVGWERWRPARCCSPPLPHPRRTSPRRLRRRRCPRDRPRRGDSSAAMRRGCGSMVVRSPRRRRRARVCCSRFCTKGRRGTSPRAWSAATAPQSSSSA